MLWGRIYEIFLIFVANISKNPGMDLLRDNFIDGIISNLF